MLTTKQAAYELGIEPKTVAIYIWRGLIHAEKFGRDYLIEDQELERFKRNRRKPGKPRKKKSTSSEQKSEESK